MTEEQVVNVRADDGNSVNDHADDVKVNGVVNGVGALDLENGEKPKVTEINHKDAVSNGAVEKEGSETATLDVVLKEGELKCVESQNGAGSVQNGVAENGDESTNAVTEELVTDHDRDNEDYVVVGASDVQNGVAEESEVGGDVNVSVNGVEECQISGDADVNRSDREFEGVDVHNDVVVVTATNENGEDDDVQGSSESITDKDVDKSGESKNVVGADVSDEDIVTVENHDAEEVVEENEVPVDVDGVSATTDVRECELDDDRKGLEKGQVEPVSDVGAGVQNGLAGPEKEPSECPKDYEIAVDGEPNNKLERSEVEVGSELVPEGENLVALNNTDVIGDGDVVSDIAVESKGKHSFDVCDIKSNAIDSNGERSVYVCDTKNDAVDSEPSNGDVQSESKPAVVSEMKNNVVESEAELSNGASESEAGAVETEPAPANASVEDTEPAPANASVEETEAEAEPANASVEETEAEAEPANASVEETEAEPESANASVEETAAESGSVEETAAEPGSVEETAAEPGSVEETAAEPGSVEETAAEPGSVEETAAEPRSVEETAAEPRSVEETAAEPRSVEETAAEPCSVVSEAEPSSNGAAEGEAEAEPSSNGAAEGEAETEPSSNGAAEGEGETEPSSNGAAEGEAEAEPSSNGAVETEAEAEPSSNGAVETEAEPSSNGAVETEAEASSNGTVVTEAEASSNGALNREAEPSSGAVPIGSEIENNAVESEAEHSNGAVESEAVPSVEVSEKKINAVECEAEGSNLGDEVLRPASDALDEQNVISEVVKKPFYYLIRVPRYDDDENMREQINIATLQVDEKTKIRDAIRAECQTIKAICKECDQEFKAAIAASRAARDLLKSKRQEMDAVQSTMNRLNNAISVGDIDGKIRNMEHMIQHETLPLNEEKQLVRQIKQLKQNREELSSNMRKQDQLQQSLDQKENIEDQFKRLQLLKKELEVLRKNLQKSDAATNAAKKKYTDECDKLNELLTRFKAADEIRQESYAKLHALKKQLHEKNKFFWEYRNAANKAHELASGGKMEELQCFCVDQVERIMELWNKNDNFRKDYVRCNTRSTLRRLQTLDGRSLGPDEEPPVIPNFTTVRALKNNSMVSQSTPEQEKKSTSTESSTIKDEPVSEVVVERTETNQATKAKKPTKPVPLEKPVARWGDESDEDQDKKEPVRSKEEEEQRLKAEKSRKEEEEAKLKEKRRQEEIEKAKEALQRKKRNAEKAQQRAALKAQKEAEQKEKEREKRAKKKERRKAASVAVTAEDTEQESAPISETLTRSMEESDQSEKPAEITKKPQKSQFTKQAKAKSVPLALRNRGKRRIQPWMWVMIAVMVVVALFFVGNSSTLRSSLEGIGF